MKYWEQGVCAACRRTAIGKMKNGKEVCLTCSYTTGIATAVGSSRVLDELEKVALVEGGHAAGGYLDHIGKTDLAALSESEWLEFGKTWLMAFGDSIRRQIRENKPPF